MKRHLALFQSTRAVITVERLCRKQALRCKIIPVPRHISSECGMAIEFDENDLPAARDICVQAGVAVEFAVVEKT